LFKGFEDKVSVINRRSPLFRTLGFTKRLNLRIIDRMLSVIPQVAQNSSRMRVLSLQEAFCTVKNGSTYSFFDRGLIISSPLGPFIGNIHYESTILFSHASGNIFYDAIRGQFSPCRFI